MKTYFGRNIFLFLCYFMALSVFGCSGTVEIMTDSESGLLNEAVRYYEDKDYKMAKAAFQKLKDNYPLSKYSITAELRIADCDYHRKDYQEAIFQYEEFKKLHPTNKAIPYVMYQVGMSHFNQILSIDRDQTSTKNAAKQFEYLISRYPSDPYATSAQEKLRVCKENLAQNEYYVGYFYLKKKKFEAALFRFNGIVSNFPESDILDKVYFHIGKSYLFLEEKEKAKNALLHLLKNYPNSEYYGEAFDLLKELNERVSLQE